jgi:hypothetical protein
MGGTAADMGDVVADTEGAGGAADDEMGRNVE